MPKVKTKIMSARATDGTIVKIRVPVSIKSPPKRDLDIAKSMMNKSNWKYPTSYRDFRTKARAKAIGDALAFYVGGYEIEKVGTGWRVGSRGYYNYVGA